MQDASDDIVDATATADGECASLTAAERALLVYAKKLSLTPSEMTAEDAEQLRQTGWDDCQIAEAVYIIAMFAFFNRVADAFGLEDPEYRSEDSTKA